MDHALRRSLVHCANSIEVAALDGGFIVASQGRVKTLDSGLHLRSDHAVAKILFRGNANPLKRGLMVSQSTFLPFFTRTVEIIPCPFHLCKPKVPYSSGFFAN